jgi:eukaryotic-like serine/threonine-protein kinase
MSILTELKSGAYIQDYQLVRQLARGGMGTVWLARLRRPYDFSKLVALKLLLPQYASDEQFRLMFLDEARIASAIAHPNVAPILDLGEHAGHLYLVMEWVDGQALQEALKAAKARSLPIPPGVCVHLAAAACAGLHAAHELRDGRGQPLHVVHRDVSPQNIMVDARGHVKVIDFGVAKARNRLGQDTSTGHIKGRLSYMSPEQAGVLAATVDRRADVWSICAVLYYMLCGRRPIEADSDVAALGALLAGEAVAALPAGVPAPLARVVMAGLRHRPEERFASAEGLRVALEGAALAANVHASGDEAAAFLAGLLGEKMAARRRADREALDALDSLRRCAEPSDRADGSSGRVEPRAGGEVAATAPSTRAATSRLAPASGVLSPVATVDLVVRSDGDEQQGSLLGTSSARRGPALPAGEGPKGWLWLALAGALAGVALLGAGTARRFTRGEAPFAAPAAFASPNHPAELAASRPPVLPVTASASASVAMPSSGAFDASRPLSSSSAPPARLRVKSPPPSSRGRPERVAPAPSPAPSPSTPPAPPTGDVAGALRDRH